MRSEEGLRSINRLLEAARVVAVEMQEAFLIYLIEMALVEIRRKERMLDSSDPPDINH